MFQDISFTILGQDPGSELEFLNTVYFPSAISASQETANNLRHLLCSDTVGKRLLEKSGKEPLSPRDRAYIVRVIVESELKCLEKLNNTIRKDVWVQWATEITQLFKEESSDLYYVPYKVIGGKVIQASGLIHNRLITHRRSLAPEGRKRKCSSSSSESDSGHSLEKTSDCGINRVRPLPDSFKEYSVDESSCLDEQLEWLRSSSSPFDVVIAKWQATFHLRNRLLEHLSYAEYFNTFLALQLPNGYKLVSCTLVSLVPNLPILL